MFAVEFALTSVVILNLVLQLRLVLQTDQVHPQLLQRLQLPVLQFLHGLVVADQHGVFHLFLGLLLVQLLGEDREERKEEGSMDDLQCGVLLFDQLVFNETFSHVEINFLLFGFKLRILATAEKSIHITHEILSLSCFKLNTSFSP